MIITSSAFGSGWCLGGLDFDHSGDLWVSVVGSNGGCEADAQLVEFTPSQLSTGGNLTPSITISPNSKNTNLASPGPIRFGPVTFKVIGCGHIHWRSTTGTYKFSAH